VKTINEAIKLMKEAAGMATTAIKSSDLTEPEQAFVRNVLKQHIFTAIGALEYLASIMDDNDE